MRKSTIILGLVLVVALVVCANNAYAMDNAQNCPIRGAFNSIGGFLYNALPWNWGSWAGK